MSATELAWAAGFFDGEGSTYIVTTRATEKNKRLNDRKVLCMEIKQADSFVLERFRDAVEAGTVRGPFRKSSWPDHYKDQWSWELYASSKCIEVYGKLHPYLSPVKRAQAAMCMDLMEEYQDSLRRRTYK